MSSKIITIMVAATLSVAAPARADVVVTPADAYPPVGVTVDPRADDAPPRPADPTATTPPVVIVNNYVTIVVRHCRAHRPHRSHR